MENLCTDRLVVESSKLSLMFYSCNLQHARYGLVEGRYGMMDGINEVMNRRYGMMDSKCSLTDDHRRCQIMVYYLSILFHHMQRTIILQLNLGFVAY